MKPVKYDINAVCVIEEMTGMSIVRLFTDQSNIERISIVRKLYYAGRMADDKKLTLYAAGLELQELIGAGESLVDVVEKITEGLMSTGIFPKPGDEAGEPEGNPTSPA
jgi:hypothetical protein